MSSEACYRVRQTLGYHIPHRRSDGTDRIPTVMGRIELFKNHPEIAISSPNQNIKIKLLLAALAIVARSNSNPKTITAYLNARRQRHQRLLPELWMPQLVLHHQRSQ
jgi:hypothetical protein